MPPDAAPEAPFRPRPRLHVRLRPLRRRLARERTRLLATLLAASAAAASLALCARTLRRATEAGLADSSAALGAGGAATTWFVLGAGAAALIPVAMRHDPEKRALLPSAADLAAFARNLWRAARERAKRRA